jgi:hypothetical protein
MANILDEIKTRLAEAQKQLVEATQTLSVAQQKHQAAQHNFNIWNAALQIEQREEQLRQAATAEKQPDLPIPNLPTVAVRISTPNGVAVFNGLPATLAPQQESADEQDVPSKTDIVRNLLREHPAGMSAVDLWKTVGSRFGHRPYLYSILKRLRDRGEIQKRRNKYTLAATPKSEEEKVQPNQIVH